MNEDNIETAPNVPPFVRYVASTIPMVFDNSLSYYEALGALAKSLQDTVDVVNNNGTVTEEYIQFTKDMKEYMDHYFDNLDVQEEINNKLDEMAESGTLTELIGAYCQPLIDEQNNTINEFKDSVNQEIAEINNEVQAITSGSPLVASSTAEMTETDRVYVNTTDGKWYYYDGDSWEIGGTYQSSGVADESINYMAFDAITSSLYLSKIPTYTVTEGSFVNSNGSINSADSYQRTSDIAVKKGETLIVYTNAIASVSVLAKHINSVYYPLVFGNGSAGYYKYTAESDMNIAISGRKDTFSKVKILTTIDYNSVKDYTSVYYLTGDITDNTYIYYVNGTVQTQDNYRSTDYIPVLPNSAITLESLDTLVASLSGAGIAFYDDSKTFISGVQYTVNTSMSITTPENAKFCRYSIRKSSKNVVVKCTDPLTSIFNEVRKTNNNNTQWYDLSLFPKVAVCGDSYAVGVYKESSGGEIAEHPTMSWPVMLQKKYGFTLKNYSHGGRSTRTFIANDLNTVLTDNKSDLYLLALERNDVTIYSGDSDYLGSISDITSHTLGNYPDTFYGNYATIIESILGYNANAKVVMILGDYLSSETSGTTFNNAMKEIAEHYSIPYIEENNDSYFMTSMYRSKAGGENHPNAVQYNGMSKALDRLFSSCLVNYESYFRYIILSQ